MEGLTVSRANGKRRINWLPSQRKLRSFRRPEVAKVVISLLVIELKAVEPREIPGRTRHRKTNFPVGRPDIAAAFGRGKVCRAGGLAGSSQRIRVVGRVLRPVVDANRE